MYDKYEIYGAEIQLPEEIKDTSVIINTGDRLWIWCNSSGSYVSIYIEDGIPVTEGNIKPPVPDDRPVKKKWNADFK